MSRPPQVAMSSLDIHGKNICKREKGEKLYRDEEVHQGLAGGQQQRSNVRTRNKISERIVLGILISFFFPLKSHYTISSKIIFFGFFCNTVSFLLGSFHGSF